jgi:glycerophosphoryl diester phosphodiesterase
MEAMMNRIKSLSNLLILISLVSFCCQKINPTVLVTAHRGASGLAPENSMSSMLKALELGADFAELDVQETSDGVLILLHDNSLKRTTGLEKNIWEMDYTSLIGIDAGQWYDSKFKGEPIPRLESVMDTVRGKMKLNIELKYNSHDKRLAERVVELVVRKNYINECILTSFNFEAINLVRKLNKTIKVGYIFSKIPEGVDVFTADVDLLSVNYKLVEKDFVEKAHANDKEVHVWTVNEPEEMQRLINLGVESIITNRPDLLVTLLKTI